MVHFEMRLYFMKLNLHFNELYNNMSCNILDNSFNKFGDQDSLTILEKKIRKLN